MLKITRIITMMLIIVTLTLYASAQGMMGGSSGQGSGSARNGAGGMGGGSGQGGMVSGGSGQGGMGGNSGQGSSGMGAGSAQGGMMGGGSSQGGMMGYGGYQLEQNLVLPMITVGQGTNTTTFTTTLVLTNLGDAERMGWTSPQNLLTTGTIYFFKQDGTRFPVQVNGAAAATEYGFSLNASEILNLELASAGPDILGWALIDVDENTESGSVWGVMDGESVIRGGRLSATVFYSLNQAGELLARVGVVASKYESQRYLTSVLAARLQRNVNTGVAMVNISAQDISVDIRLRDTQGQILVTKTLLLKKGNQTVGFIDELFTGAVPSEFQGALEIVTRDEGLVTMGLLVSQGILTSIPTYTYGQWSMGSGAN